MISKSEAKATVIAREILEYYDVWHHDTNNAVRLQMLEQIIKNNNQILRKT